MRVAKPSSRFFDVIVSEEKGMNMHEKPCLSDTAAQPIPPKEPRPEGREAANPHDMSGFE